MPTSRWRARRRHRSGRTAADLEAVEQDLFPIDSVVTQGIVGLLVLELDLFFDVRFGHFQQRVLLDLLLKVHLQIQHGHVEQLHRLIQAWVDPHFQSLLGTLVEFHAESVHR